MAGVGIDVAPLLWAAGTLWTLVSLGASLLLLLLLRRPPVHRVASSGWPYAAGILVINVIAAVFLCALMGSLAWELLVFAVAIGVVSGGIVGVFAGRRRGQADWGQGTAGRSTGA
jgi:hypothetical protein